MAQNLQNPAQKNVKSTWPSIAYNTNASRIIGLQANADGWLLFEAANVDR